MKRSCDFSRSLPRVAGRWTICLTASWLGVVTTPPVAVAKDAGPKTTSAPARKHPRGYVPGKPLLIWDNTVHNWGRKLVNDEKIIGTFTFRNEGDAPLELTKVKPSCGCTTVGGYDKIVAPGRSGKIRFAIDPARVSGDRPKTIKVESNSPAHRVTILKMQGKVYRLIDIQPAPRVYFRVVHQDQPSSRVLDLISKTDKPVEIREVTSDNPVFKARVRTVTKGKRFRMTVVATPPFASGPNLGKITIHTNLEKQPTITIAASAVLRPRIKVAPDPLTLRSATTWKHERVLVVINTGNTPVKITKVTSSDPALKAVVSRATRRAAQRVRVSVPAHYTVPDAGAVITLETDDPEYKIFKIPVIRDTSHRARSRSRTARSRRGGAAQTQPAEDASQKRSK